MNKPTTAVLVILSMGMTSSILAQDFEKGRRAIESSDYATAYKEWKWLAEGGLAIAQYNLGMMYEYGQYGGGFEKNFLEAIIWYRKAAEQGFAKAQTILGTSHERGEEVLQDNVYSLMWYDLASSNGDELGAKFRDELAKKMTTVDIAKAQCLVDGIGVVSSKLNALKVASVSGDIPQNVNFAINGSSLRAFLDAKNINYKEVGNESELTGVQIAARASAFTVLIECQR